MESKNIKCVGVKPMRQKKIKMGLHSTFGEAEEVIRELEERFPDYDIEIKFGVRAFKKRATPENN